MNYFITIKFLIRVMLLSNMLPSAVCVRAYAFVPAHVTWHSCLLEPIMRCSKDMFPKSLQIFHPAVDDHVCQAPDWFKIFPM